MIFIYCIIICIFSLRYRRHRRQFQSIQQLLIVLRPHFASYVPVNVCYLCTSSLSRLLNIYPSLSDALFITRFVLILTHSFFYTCHCFTFVFLISYLVFYFLSIQNIKSCCWSTVLSTVCEAETMK